jgi:hypothetical protein
MNIPLPLKEENQAEKERKLKHIGFAVPTAVVMKITIFSAIGPCNSYMN